MVNIQIIKSAWQGGSENAYEGGVKFTPAKLACSVLRVNSPPHDHPLRRIRWSIERSFKSFYFKLKFITLLSIRYHLSVLKVIPKLNNDTNCSSWIPKAGLCPVCTTMSSLFDFKCSQHDPKSIEKRGGII